MCVSQSTKAVQGHVTPAGTNYLQGLESSMVLAYGASNLIVAGWARQGTNNARVKTMYRTFVSNRSRPGAWTVVGAGTPKTPSAGSSGGEFADVQSLNALTGVMFIQGGLSAGLSAAGQGGDADVLLQCFAESNARVVATTSMEVEPDTNIGNTSIIPLGGPIPALGVTGAMVAGMALVSTGTLKLNFCFREYVSDLLAPGAWSAALLGADASLTGNVEYNSLDMPFTPSAGKSMIQLGIMIPANNARATLDSFTLAVKY